MDVLAIIHGESVRSGVFGDVVRERGHGLEEWSLAWDTPLPKPVDAYGAVLVFGAQLLAKAAQASVQPASEFEIGWFPVELTDAGVEDPVLGRLPQTFEAFQWHYYDHGIPAGGVELARNRICTQGFRLGDNAWGVQFHPEVTLAQVENWIEEEEDLPVDKNVLLAETRQRIGEWNQLGRDVCAGFVEAAERVAAPA
jgi:hypothetical protein